MTEMVDIATMCADADEQDKGTEFEVVHPVTGEPTGIKLRIAGPYSNVQQKARNTFQDEVRKSTRISLRSTISAEEIDRMHIEFLAAIILDWNIVENGKQVPFSFRNAVQIIGSSRWLREQVDEFAGNFAIYFRAYGWRPQSEAQA
jgi:hypothetical protein